MNASDESRHPAGAPTAPSRTAAYRIGRGMLGTVPIVLAGTMAVTLNVTGPLAAHDTEHHDTTRPGISPSPRAHADDVQLDLSAIYQRRATATLTADVTADVTSAATIETASAPTTYRVVAGDTVASIAGRYGLSTASVLALNGLSWKSIIYPGQTLHLTSARISPAAPTATKPAAGTATSSSTSASIYTIVRGDTLSSIAASHHVTTAALLGANGLGWSSIIYPGQKLRVPGSSASSTSAATTTSTLGTGTTTAVSTTTGGKYTIKTGDTLSSIAKSHSTTVERLLAANGLSWTSMIYAGKTLIIPGATTAAASTGSTTPVSPNTLSASQKANALTIIRVGRSLGVSDYGIVIALSAAAQESDLYNLSSGDRDSVGLFQQRPSQGWGSRASLLDTNHAARLFFGGSSNPNAGVTRGLLDIRGWSQMTVTQAAQSVQNSAYPTAYAKWEKSARIWLATL